MLLPLMILIKKTGARCTRLLTQRVLAMQGHTCVHVWACVSICVYNQAGRSETRLYLDQMTHLQL